MKKIVFIATLCLLATPVWAITDVDTKLQREQEVYQLKVEKLTQKKQLECIKHPERCTQSPVQAQEMTLGIVQRNIKIGCSQEDVALSLGSPNIVTRDDSGNDTWIYDKVASVSSYDNNGFSIGGGLLGGGGGYGGSGFGGGGGLFNVGYARNGGNTQSTQKTLTVVIKFDSQNKVKSFTYHMSKF